MKPTNELSIWRKASFLFVSIAAVNACEDKSMWLKVHAADQ